MWQKLLGAALTAFVLVGWQSVDKAQIAKPAGLTVGLPAPELALERVLQAPNGAKPEWSSLKGQVVVLEFWATWCAACIALQPHLNELTEKYKDKPVQFISITNEGEEKVDAFLKRRTIRGWVGLDLRRSVQKAYEEYGLPKTVVVDKSGNIAAILNAKNLNEMMLDQLLAGKTPAQLLADTLQPSISIDPKALEADPAQLTVSINSSKSPLREMLRDNGKFIADGADLKLVLSSMLGTTNPKGLFTA